MERVKKDLQSKFREYGDGLEIVIKCNKTIVNYLDITLNLEDGSFRPYLKPDNKLQYINTQSNHPPNVIRQIPKTIEQRLSNHSSNEQTFAEAKKTVRESVKRKWLQRRTYVQAEQSEKHTAKELQTKYHMVQPTI